MTELALTWDDAVGDFSKWDDDFKRPDLPDGVAQWGRDDDGNIKRIMYVCPCGCKDWRQVSVSKSQGVAHNWHWDGNETAPTLSPSIQHVPNPKQPGDCSWHGFLVAGVWRTC